MAAEDPDPGRAASSVAKTFGVRVVRNEARLLDRAERYDWAATKRDGRVRLSGLAPNEKTRREIIGIARATFPSNEIATLVSIVFGSLIAARRAGTLWVRGESMTRYTQLAVGGLLMGIGSGIAGGCNLGHSLVGVPLLSIGSITTSVAMFLGVALTHGVLQITMSRMPFPKSEKVAA
jgi:hypothetical protein